MAPHRFSYLCWNNRVAVRLRSNVTAQRFPRHGLAGDVFVVSVLALGASGTIAGLIKFYLTNSQAQLANFFVGTLTFYLVGTAWWAARRRDSETSIFDWVAHCGCRLELR